MAVDLASKNRADDCGLTSAVRKSNPVRDAIFIVTPLTKKPTAPAGVIKLSTVAATFPIGGCTSCE